MSPCHVQFDEVLAMLSKSHKRESFVNARTPAHATRRFPLLRMCAFIRLHVHTHTLHKHTHTPTRRNTRTNCIYHSSWLHLVYSNGNFTQSYMFTKLHVLMRARAKCKRHAPRIPCTFEKQSRILVNAVPVIPGN